MTTDFLSIPSDNFVMPIREKLEHKRIIHREISPYADKENDDEDEIEVDDENRKLPSDRGIGNAFKSLVGMGYIPTW